MTEEDNRSKWFGWEDDLIAKLNSKSSIIETATGPIEYTLDGSGPVIIGIHAAPGGYDQMRYHLKDLVDQGYTVLSWSRPGYLRTPMEVGTTADQQADALAALMDGLKIDQAAIYGISAGGPVALSFALRYPDRVWGLIMECAISQYYVVQPDSLAQKLFNKLMFNDFGMWLWDFFAKYTPKSTVRQLIAMESSLTPRQASELLDQVMTDPKKVAYVSQLIESTCPISLRKVGFKNDLAMCSSMPFLPLQNLRCPTLVLHGTADADVPIQHSEFVAALVPNADFVRIENGFHLLKLSEQAEQIFQKKCSFLNEASQVLSNKP